MTTDVRWNSTLQKASSIALLVLSLFFFLHVIIVQFRFDDSSCDFLFDIVWCEYTKFRTLLWYRSFCTVTKSSSHSFSSFKESFINPLELRSVCSSCFPRMQLKFVWAVSLIIKLLLTLCWNEEFIRQTIHMCESQCNVGIVYLKLGKLQ